jgi:hypothetical protein
MMHSRNIRVMKCSVCRECDSHVRSPTESSLTAARLVGHGARQPVSCSVFRIANV